MKKYACNTIIFLAISSNVFSQKESIIKLKNTSKNNITNVQSGTSNKPYKLRTELEGGDSNSINNFQTNENVDTTKFKNKEVIDTTKIKTKKNVELGEKIENFLVTNKSLIEIFGTFLLIILTSLGIYEWINKNRKR